jgi:hypothetical protein
MIPTTEVRPLGAFGAFGGGLTEGFGTGLGAMDKLLDIKGEQGWGNILKQLGGLDDISGLSTMPQPQPPPPGGVPCSSTNWRDMPARRLDQRSMPDERRNRAPP